MSKIERAPLKRQVMVMIKNFPEDRKKELIEKYKNDEKYLSNHHARAILIGNWVDNAAKMLERGLTKDELDKVIEHIIVLISSAKNNLNVWESYKDCDLLYLSRKYLGGHKTVRLSGEHMILDIEEEP